MTALRKPKLTAAEYLAIERRAETKSEFFNGEMYAMAGASEFHNDVKENLIVELGTRLKGSPCRTRSSDPRVFVPTSGLYAYPDIVILCGPTELDPLGMDTVTNPRAVIEVLSPSTEKYDRGLKRRNYQLIPSLVEYVLVAHDEPLCERYTRQADGLLWGVVDFVGLAAVLEFTSVPARIPLADIYNGVAFPDEPPR